MSDDLTQDLWFFGSAGCCPAEHRFRCKNHIGFVPDIKDRLDQLSRQMGEIAGLSDVVYLSMYHFCALEYTGTEVTGDTLLGQSSTQYIYDRDLAPEMVQYCHDYVTTLREGYGDIPMILHQPRRSVNTSPME